MSGIDILWRYNELDSRRNRLTYTGAYCLYKPLAQLALGLKVSGNENIPNEESSAVTLPNEPVNQMLAGSDPSFVILSPGLKEIAVRALLADEPSRAELASALDQASADREIEFATISAIAESVDRLSDEEEPAADFMAEYRRLMD